MSKAPSASSADREESAADAPAARISARPAPEFRSRRKSRDFSLRILRGVALYLDEKKGPDALAAVAAAAGLSADELREAKGWVDYEGFEALHGAARDAMESDAEFMRAASYRMADAYGPFRYFLWASTPRLVFSVVTAAVKQVAPRCGYAVRDLGPNAVQLSYTSSFPDSRLMCASRRAQLAFAPVVWEMPDAQVTERACIAHGDDACVYDIVWYSRPRWLPAILGLVLGVGLAFGLSALRALSEQVVFASLPIAGALLGYAYELRRNVRGNLETRDAVTKALREVVAEEALARREIQDLHDRQREWSRALEEVAADRSDALSRVVSRLEGLQEKRELRIRGFSHDLRNPLMVVSATTSFLKEDPETKLGAEALEALDDVDASISRMQRMLGDLLTVATTSNALVKFVPERLETTEIVESLRRRLKALVYGRDVRASVFETREAPSAIEIDPLLFDRIVDNLLGNAAKYTARGSIIVEIDGTPGYFVLKISDTGRGISPSAIDRIFFPGGSDPELRAKNSFGVGLSVVVQLVDQVGGNIEVMSKEGQGTTFWVRLPSTVESGVLTVGSQGPSAPSEPPESEVERVRRVVRIRKKPS